MCKKARQIIKIFQIHISTDVRHSITNSLYSTAVDPVDFTLQTVQFKIILHKGMLGTLSLIHCVKLFQPLSRLSRNKQVSAYNCSFLISFQSHGCKEILFSLLDAKKIGDAVFLYVFNKGFPASLLSFHTL